MKKILILVFTAALAGCSCICPSGSPVRVISNEKNTNIYYNGEYLGADSTLVAIRNKHIENAIISGEKKGCKTTEIKPEYVFDIGVLWILDLRNIVRLFDWDVYRLSDPRDIYNVTPKCD